MLAVGDTFDSWGIPIAPEDAVIPKARALIELLQADVLPFVRLLGVKKLPNDLELVLLEVHPEVPTRAVHDIRIVEPIAIRFDPGDRYEPTALAQRTDFPDVPHTFLVGPELPKSLCLFDEAYAEQRLHWTAASYVRQLHRWLSDTARGELHKQDQPLEPLLMGSPNAVVLPSTIFEVDPLDGPQRLSLCVVPRADSDEYTLVASKDDQLDGLQGVRPCTAIVVEAKPQTHRGLRFQPSHLGELDAYLRDIGVDLLGAIRDNLRTWIIEQAGEPDSSVIIVVRIPRRRADDISPEAIEVWAFGLGGNAREVGEALGFVATIEGQTGAIVGTQDLEARTVELGLAMFNPVRALTRRNAGRLSGHDDAPAVRILAIGAGALGSQTILHLVRSGFGIWTIVDRDVLLPHNLVRHALPGRAVGWEKAVAVSHLANDLIEGGAVATPLNLDVLADPFPDPLLAEFGPANVIVDFSASVPVARRLASDAPSPARRMSLFLNPSGTDLVLLAEDEARRYRLDQLEMQYYRSVMTRDDLADHLLVDGQRLRYGYTCRDVTSTLSQEALGMLSGVAAMALRETIAQPDARLMVWRTSPDHAISPIHVDPVASDEVVSGDWRIVIDADVSARLRDLREAALPNETGGVLLGSRDVLRGILYIVDTIPSPTDSEEWPTAYIRGATGLRELVDEAARRTGGGLNYLGEWHSHPTGAACSPSADDLKFLAWLTEHMFTDGFPGLMGIVCDGGKVAWQLATVIQKDPDSGPASVFR